MKKLSIMLFVMLAIGGMHMALAGEGGQGSTAPPKKLERATFAGGCFWCMEPPFKKLKGVDAVISGYTGGRTENPTYEQVSSGRTGHAEAIEVHYDPSQITYAQLLDVFWRNIDPTTKDRQFVDIGSLSRTAIFYHNEEQKRLAEDSRKKLDASRRFGKPIVTEIVPAGKFYAAEEYHQDYYKKSSARYKFYRFNSGRDQYLEKIWGKEKDK
jgi:methionine-S-sulfoxide reductase